LKRINETLLPLTGFNFVNPNPSTDFILSTSPHANKCIR